MAFQDFTGRNQAAQSTRCLGSCNHILSCSPRVSWPGHRWANLCFREVLFTLTQASALNYSIHDWLTDACAWMPMVMPLTMMTTPILDTRLHDAEQTRSAVILCAATSDHSTPHITSLWWHVTTTSLVLAKWRSVEAIPNNQVVTFSPGEATGDCLPVFFGAFQHQKRPVNSANHGMTELAPFNSVCLKSELQGWLQGMQPKECWHVAFKGSKRGFSHDSHGHGELFRLFLLNQLKLSRS